ncbi:MAG: PIG-L family deacetylase [Oscillospiraceae bacterium]
MNNIMRYISLVVVLVGIVSLSTNINAATLSTPSATDITAQTKFTSNVKETTLSNLQDNNLKTKWKHSGTVTINLVAPEKIHSIYMVSDLPLGNWSIESNTQTQVCGEGGFIHDYVKIKSPSETISITIENNEMSLCDILVFSKGEPPKYVQNWNMPYEKADMLVFSTHADDEHLWFGGTLPTYAGEQKKKVQVAYITNHWTEWYRPHELLNGLWTVGIRAYPVIGGFPDKFAADLAQAEKMYNRDDMQKYAAMLIRRFKPEVVIAQDLNGEYGHGVHILGAQSVCEAVKTSADAQVYPKIAQQFGVWDVKKLYLHLYEKNPIVMNWDKPLQNFGGETAFEMAKKGFACHQSQTKHFAVRQTGKYDCRKFGLYRSLVGEDKNKDDFFENIKITQENPEVSQPTSQPNVQDLSSIATVPPLGSDVEAPLRPVSPVIHTRNLIIIGVIGASVIALSITVLIVFALQRRKKENKNKSEK